ncbi:MAG: efflux RND transporter permease subunit [Planctomycetota bacterium]|jgi:predicted RND superfamily exporter protein
MRGGVLGLFVLLAALAATRLPQLRFDHDTRSLLRSDPAEDEREAILAERFGSDDVLLVAWEVGDALQPDVFANIASITRELAAIEGLEEIYSIASPRVLLPLTPGALPRPIRPEDLVDPDTRRRVAEVLRAAPVYVGTICSRDLDVVAVAGTLQSAPRAQREATIRAVRAVARRHGSLHVSGVTALALAASEYAIEDLLEVGGAALLISVLVLLVLCGSWRETLIAVLATGLPPLLALGLAASLGWPVTALGAALFPVLAVVGITSTVHLLNAYAGERDAWKAARRVAPPILLSLSTTAAAFAALQLTGVPAFRAAGLLVGAGVLIAIPVVLVGVPIALDLIRPPASRSLAMRLDRPLVALYRMVARAPRRVVCAAILLAAICLPLALKAPVEVNVLQSFEPKSDIARTYRFLEERLTATLPVDLVVEAGRNPPLDELRAFEKAALAIPGVESALGLQSLVAYGLSITPLGEMAALAFLRTALGRITQRFEHRESGSYRVKVRVREGTPPEVLDDLEAVRARTISTPSSLTGLYVRAVRTTRALIGDLARATLIMVLAVCVLIGVVLRSVRFALAALLPNLLAPLVVFAGASLLGIALDVSAVAVGGVAVGLAVDDTIHMLFAVRDRSRSIRSALLGAQRTVGRALVLSTLVLATGLLCLLSSRFLPTARFGALAAAASVVALIADLVVLPAALLVRRRL